MTRLSLVLLLALAACPKAPEVPAAAVVTPEAPPVRGNPLLVASTLPFSLPPFDQIQDADFEPAFAVGMAEQAAEVMTRYPQDGPFIIPPAAVAGFSHHASEEKMGCACIKSPLRSLRSQL